MAQGVRFTRGYRSVTATKRKGKEHECTDKKEAQKHRQAPYQGRGTAAGKRTPEGGERTAKKVTCLSSNGQKTKAIMELRHKYDLAVLLGCLKMSRCNFYYHSKGCVAGD